MLIIDIHFTIPRRVEGWVNLGGWPHTQTVYLSAESPMQVVTGPGVD